MLNEDIPLGNLESSSNNTQLTELNDKELSKILKELPIELDINQDIDSMNLEDIEILELELKKETNTENHITT